MHRMRSLSDSVGFVRPSWTRRIAGITTADLRAPTQCSARLRRAERTRSQS